MPDTFIPASDATLFCGRLKAETELERRALRRAVLSGMMVIVEGERLTEIQHPDSVPQLLIHFQKGLAHNRRDSNAPAQNFGFLLKTANYRDGLKL